jgi:hypothetical protein
MDARAVAWRRLAMVAAAVTAVAVLAMPAAALGKAKAATRFVVASQTVVDWSSGSSVAAPVISVKLQKKSGKKWVALRGAIKAYYLDPSTSAWVLAGSITGSNVTLTMPVRGRYMVRFAGTSSAKAATAYTARYDTIGEVISPVSATFDVSDPTWITVSIAYDVTWNTDAFPSDSLRPIEFGYWGSFEDNDEDDPHYSGHVYFYQQLWEPGTVRFSYRIRKSDVPSDQVGSDPTSFNTAAWIYPGDNYIDFSQSMQEDSTTNPL